MTIHNIKVYKGELHGNLEDGRKVIGHYRINKDDSVTLLDLFVLSLDATDFDDLKPSQVDYSELEDVIDMKLGNFVTSRASQYGV